MSNATPLPVSRPEPFGHIPLVECTRGDLVESVHAGSFAVVNTEGEMLLSAGAPDGAIYARSSLKPMQLLAMLRSGLELPDELLALGTASHSGAPMHTEGAERILALHGLTPDALLCPPDLPAGPAEREAWLRDGGEANRLAHNCSGKHSSMLATCVINGWPQESYLDPSHPLQQRVLATFEEFTGEAPAALTADGCGTPLPSYSLRALALAYARFAAAAPESPEGRIVAAMKRDPEMMSGEGRDDARLMHAVPTLFCKGGAEAVHLLGLDGGIGIAIKVADGNARASLPIIRLLLEKLGVPADQLALLGSDPILGGGRPVGELRTVASVREAVLAA